MASIPNNEMGESTICESCGMVTESSDIGVCDICGQNGLCPDCLADHVENECEDY